ncbi:MAG: Ig-like domain-containing protein [Gemmatimonadota bacterium]
MKSLGVALLAVFTLAGIRSGVAQTPARIDVTPATVTLDLGGNAQLKAVAYDSAGRRLDVPIAYFSTARRSLEVDSTGRMTALKPGEFKVTAVALGPGGGAPVRGEAAVTVRPAALKAIAIQGAPATYYALTTTRHKAVVTDGAGTVRRDQPVRWRSENESVASVDQFGDVTAHRPGAATITVSAGGVAATMKITVVPNPARSLTLTASTEKARTGDVVHFSAQARDAGGRVVGDLPVVLSLKSVTEDTMIASEPPAMIEQDGRFVAQRAGDYSVVATAGSLSAIKTIAVDHRYTSIRLAEGKGHGRVKDVRTSDIWVWPGKDGRDYALTGTWGGAGTTYFWDVTDPANLIMTDSLVLDARTTNDVKVDVEREICVITREGASNRKNGFVLVDCHDPHHVKIISTFDDGLWGGVHNVFVWNKRVFATNAGGRFDIINIEDPKKPWREGYFELDTPGHGIHDMWVVDGIAYASQWQDGVILVDVGNGKYGGSPSHPVEISRYAYPIGATHSAFPYKAKDGKFYVFVGDEQFPYNLPLAGPDEASGYIHIVDFTDVKKPKEVARYQIPEAGPHNFWIENDTMYVAYYNAGLRVVDVSGELMGNLYDQGRELARFKAFDPSGIVPNAAMAWGPQPYKGHVFFSDHHSGIWSVKLPERKETLVP